MPKYQGYVIRKEYFLMEFEANDIDDANDKIMELEIEDEPVDIDWDFYDIKEIQND